MITLRVLSLNCWGVPIPVVCQKRKERMAAIGSFLGRLSLDIVVLQEVWDKEDYADLCRLTSGALPFTHYFFSGMVGSGLCVLSKFPLQDTLFHSFQLNGFPHKIFHGDWYGGKGVGLVMLNINGFKVHVYATHTHAEYNTRNDEYASHRLSQAFELSQFFRLTYSTCHLAILAGDLNMEPSSLGIRLLLSNTGLHDAWADKRMTHGREDGQTYDNPQNVFTNCPCFQAVPQGKRIDYVFYKPNLGTLVTVEDCSILNSTVPNLDINLSDHEAVSAILNVEMLGANASQDFGAVCPSLLDNMMEAVVVVERGLESMDRQTAFWWVLTLLLVAAVLACMTSFLCPLAPFLTLPLAYAFWMAAVVKRQERHGLRSTLLDITTRLAAIQHKN